MQRAAMQSTALASKPQAPLPLHMALTLTLAHALCRDMLRCLVGAVKEGSTLCNEQQCAALPEHPSYKHLCRYTWHLSVLHDRRGAPH